MKNKGFTLMELLAVIVIIGIISAIAIPMYGNLRNENNENSLKYYASLVRQAVNLYEAEYMPKYGSDVTCIDISYQKLLDLDLIKEEKLKCKNNGVIRGTRINSNGFKYDLYLECEYMIEKKGKIDWIEVTTSSVKDRNTLPEASCLKIN